MAQAADVRTDEVVICLVLKESGLEIRYASEDPAQRERTHLILAHLSVALESLKAALSRGFAATQQ
jgi:hypothetical protein